MRRRTTEWSHATRATPKMAACRGERCGRGVRPRLGISSRRGRQGRGEGIDNTFTVERGVLSSFQYCPSVGTRDIDRTRDHDARTGRKAAQELHRRVRAEAPIFDSGRAKKTASAVSLRPRIGLRQLQLLRHWLLPDGASVRLHIFHRHGRERRRSVLYARGESSRSQSDFARVRQTDSLPASRIGASVGTPRSRRAAQCRGRSSQNANAGKRPRGAHHSIGISQATPASEKGLRRASL
jgi:hypothetical protein